MKKLIATAAAAALMLAVSSPAMAEVESEVGDENEGNVRTAQFVDASQFQGALQLQYGDATADADDDSTAEATVDVSQEITFNQANAGLGEIDDANQGGNDAGDFFED